MDQGIAVIISTVGMAAFGWAFKLGRDWVLIKISNSKNELFKKNMQILVDTVYDVVMSLMQTTVNAIKTNNNGVLGPITASKVKQQAIETVKLNLANHVTKYLEKTTGAPITKIIDVQIEKTVGELNIESACQ